MTSNQPKKSYSSIRIDGPISVTPVSKIPRFHSPIVLLLGPTGSGKSSFIEALAPKGSLQISSHLLEGCTQSISIYVVENVTSVPYSGQRIYIVDVPGFGDTKISEMSIVVMIRKFMRDMGITNIGRILYFTPINGVRLPGSQRRMLKTFQDMTGIETEGNIMIVTTMWDILSGESSMQRAQRNFEQLQDVVWKDYIQNGCLIVRFDNNVESALCILDDACRRLVQKIFPMELSSSIRETAFGVDLYNNLQIRIQNLQIQRANIRSELEVATLGPDSQLVTVLASQLEETEKILARFNQELKDFGPPPSPESVDDAMVEPTLPSHQPSLPSHPAPAKRRVFARAISSFKCWGQDLHERHDL
ncbi:P-loop containing nucleoside triphosphate hydrolase protein [Panaeolus papilionaceus]|nr:P-loop containing nucleoside triphosphate hydrolase protein [Panaeolus papilionaceus]